MYLGGGLSHHDSFDPKPEAAGRHPRQVQPNRHGRIGAANRREIAADGKGDGSSLPLVRSGAHNNDHHETATNWVLSGRFGTPFGDYPAVGAVVAHETGFSGTLPPYVAVPRNPSFTWELGKSAFLGGRYESFKAGDPNQANYKVQDLTTDTDREEIRHAAKRS